MTMNDGGPAFPRQAAFGRRSAKHGGRSELVESVGQTGMTLRDYFAGQALSGVIAAHHVGRIDHAVGSELHASFAAHAYAVADAMLAQRDGGQR